MVGFIIGLIIGFPWGFLCAAKVQAKLITKDDPEYNDFEEDDE